MIISEVLKLVQTIALINIIFMLAGLLFDVELFQSYPYSERFGVNGIFARTSEASFIYIFCIILSYFELNRKDKGISIKFITYLTASLLIGTKAILLFLALLVFIHFTYKVSKNTKALFYSVIATFVILSIKFYNQMIDFIFAKTPFWERVYMDYGILGVITSTRNRNFTSSMEYIKDNWNWINYLFGGYDFLNKRPEMEFVDIFLFFGFFGLLVYLWAINHFFLKEIKDKIKFSILVEFLIVVTFVGNFFSSVLIGMIFYLISFKLKDKEHAKNIV
jgi:hypothetical protein